MATEAKEIAVLIECVNHLCRSLIKGYETCDAESVVEKLASLSLDDAPASPEIKLCIGCWHKPCTCDREPTTKDSTEPDYCGKCKQRPCGCRECDCDKPLPYPNGPSDRCYLCDGKIAPVAMPPTPAKCKHEAKHVVSGYVSQNDVTCVICSQCSTVGKRFDGGPIQWWPASVNERAREVLKELKNYLKAYVGEYTNASTMWIDAKLRELGGTR